MDDEDHGGGREAQQQWHIEVFLIKQNTEEILSVCVWERERDLGKMR